MAAVVKVTCHLRAPRSRRDGVTFRENEMREGLKGRVGAASITVGLLGPMAAGAQGPWEAPAAEKARANPIAPGPDVVARGKHAAQLNCVPCHGTGGKGDGPAAAALKSKPADWTSPAVQADPDGDLFWKITNGRGAMPPWKHVPEPERWAIVHYIRSLKAK
jgi:mono/diheme cytochrome c family protein